MLAAVLITLLLLRDFALLDMRLWTSLSSCVIKASWASGDGDRSSSLSICIFSFVFSSMRFCSSSSFRLGGLSTKNIIFYHLTLKLLKMFKHRLVNQTKWPKLIQVITDDNHPHASSKQINSNLHFFGGTQCYIHCTFQGK